MTDTPRGIRYVSDDSFTWLRKRQGKGFQFLTSEGAVLPLEESSRLKKLVIPPAWKDVKLCAHENGHILAVGFDAKGRKQYIYHPRWVSHKQEHKFDKMIRFGEVLPELRQTVSGHMRQHNLSKDRILATVVWLLEHTFIRVGNKEYEKENHSYGLTTLRERHVSVTGDTLKFSFKGKSGIFHELEISNPRVANTVKKCIELPGYELFQYLDETQNRQTIDSQDVNEYLQSTTGEELSAKDFRTWGGTTLAGEILYKLGSPVNAAAAKDGLCQAVKEVSAHLRNTATVCRKYYIHPAIVRGYEEDILVPHFSKIYQHRGIALPGLNEAEYASWTLLQEK